MLKRIHGAGDFNCAATRVFAVSETLEERSVFSVALLQRTRLYLVCTWGEEKKTKLV